MTDSRYLELGVHCAQSLRNANVFSKPYPHLAFEKFWPEDFYRELPRFSLLNACYAKPVTEAVY